MKRTTKVAGIALAATLLCSTAVPALAAGRFGSGAANAGTGVCQSQNWVDEDGNGICDNAGTCQNERRVDADGDGVCDNAGTCQHHGCQDGTGIAACHRYGNGR